MHDHALERDVQRNPANGVIAYFDLSATGIFGNLNHFAEQVTVQEGILLNEICGAHDEQYVASDGYANGRASRWIALIPACDYRPLWPGAIDGKAAQGIAAAGKEFLAQGYAARRKLLGQAKTQIVGPGQIGC